MEQVARGKLLDCIRKTEVLTFRANQPSAKEVFLKRALVLISAISLALSYAAPSRSQQQAPRGGGGGFRRPDPIDFEEHDGWVSLFDGKTLKGWSGDDNWRVEDGAIVIESTCEKPTGTIYLVWQGGEAADFELKLEMKGTGNINGGVQYRGWIVPPNQGPGGGGGNAQQQAQPCPSGAPRGTPPDRVLEAKWNMAGAQYDFDAANRYPGQFYEQATGRGIIALRGKSSELRKGRIRAF